MLRALSPLLPFLLGYLWYRGVPPVYLVYASGAILLYFWFVAPATCGAPLVTARRPCEANVNGVLKACHLQAHKARKRAQIRTSLRKLLRLPSPAPPALPTVRSKKGSAVPAAMYAGAPPAPPPSHVGLTRDQVIGLAGLIVSAGSLLVSVLAWQLPQAAG